MRSRDIVRKAWQITQVHLKKLIWYGVVPAFFSVIVSSVYLAYQYHAFKTSVIFSDQSNADVIGTARTLWGLVSSYPTLSIVLIVIGIIIFLGYVITPPIFNGTMINAIMRIKNYEPIDGSVEIGVRRFFPMFEFSLLTGAFGITTLFTESSFILRWWGENVFFVVLPILLFVVMIGFLISFLFTYAEYYIVLEDKPLMRSIMDSTILVISNLRRTFLIFILIILISARIILNVLLVLLIPMMVVIVAGYFTSVWLSIIGYIVVGVLGLAILCVSSYLLGLFHIFTTAVWVLTFSILAHKENPEIKDVDLGKDTFRGAPAPNPIQPAPGHSFEPKAS
ncbi:hypothetical protein KKA95_03420 [Patescibacteria group bacterium]|nr:hypothetical protein [Patescibacteria group bacterium]